MTDRTQRRLAAVVAADIAGYSRLMREDEDATMQAWWTYRKEVVDPVVSEYGGRIVKLTGDGFLAEFSSATDAVAAAIAMQSDIAPRVADIPEDKRVQFRMGVNLGDILWDDEDIYGDGVNIAARIEALADPGGVLVSASVYDQVRRRVDAVFEDMGEHSLKNIDTPMRVYRVCGPFGAPDGPEKAASPADGAFRETPAPKETPLHEMPSIAVLPFDNMSGDKEQEYFSDGLTEDIITALSQWRSMPVIARNSTFTYKGQAVNVQQVARELGVQYVMEGSIRRSGNRIRITAQLIDGRSGHHVWAEKYDRELEDVFEVQDEITSKIAAIVMPEVQSFEHRRTVSKRTEDLTAWDYYLRGMETFNDETCPGTAAALEMFDKAVEHDPNFSDAWARKSWCHAKEVMFACTEDTTSALEQGFIAGRRAIALDDSSPVAHLALGTVHIWADETDQGLEEALTAVNLNPNFTHAAMAAGNRLDLVGRAEEGIEMMEHALKLNPRDPIRWRYMAYLSRAYISRNDFERAVDWSSQAVKLRADHPETQFRHAVSLAQLDKVDDARHALERCRELDPGYIERHADWRPYPDEDRNRRIMDGLRRHELI